tara:strand:- start:546 stop:1244 length:699 start_codon:yes stop_codon:yes gene_type:complete
MQKKSKRIQESQELVKRNTLYDLDEAIKIVKKAATAKFSESIDLTVQLGIDAKKSDQNVRGAIVLPSGTGKKVRVAVFAQGEKADQANEQGAEIVGMEELAKEIKSGKLDFDVLIASPDTMRLVGSLGQILGPRGLMPNPKVGTVTQDIAQAVKNAKAGQVQYKTDKSGIIHCSIGQSKFDDSAIKENLMAVIGALNKSKPAASKGVYLKKIALSSTMGPGVKVEPQSLSTV